MPGILDLSGSTRGWLHHDWNTRQEVFKRPVFTAPQTLPNQSARSSCPRMHDAPSQPLGLQANIVQRLRSRIADVRSMGFQIRQEFLHGQPSAWCEIGGKKTIFLDASQSAAEQMAALDEAIRSYQPAAGPTAP